MAQVPFMNAYGMVTKILDKMIEASQPERFTQDYLANKLGFTGGSARPIIPLLKKIGFVAADGTPTSLYSKFRNPESRGAAMVEGIRTGYKDLYERSEYVHDLPKDKLKNLVIEMTGMKANDPTVGAIVNTFNNLRAYAKFDAASSLDDGKKVMVLNNHDDPPPPPPPQNSTGLNLSYTINLNLPETSDVEVFNAIFRSLKENLLKV
jgi:hypothetical protein